MPYAPRAARVRHSDDQQAAIASPLLDNQEAARVLGLHEVTLRKWRQRGQGPRYYKVSNAVRYRLDDLLNFMKPVDPTAKQAA